MNKKLSASVKSFLVSILILVCLCIFTYVLTFILDKGEFSREIVDGNTKIIPDSYHTLEDTSYPFYKFIFAPFLLFTSDAGLTTGVIILFLLIVGGSMASVNKSGLFSYIIDKLVFKFGHKRYFLVAIVSLFFMCLGSFVGSFEEVVPFVPICVTLAYSLGFDAFTGIGMSILSVGCGFASGLMNSFTTGIAQKIAGLPLFSGFGFRLLSAILIYAMLVTFLLVHSKRIAKPCLANISNKFEIDRKKEKGTIAFASILGGSLVAVILATLNENLSTYSLIIVALGFFASCITSTIVSGTKGKDTFKYFVSGAVEMLPAVLMILLAGSVKYILSESKTIDTILYLLMNTCENMPKVVIVLFVYLIVLIFNFFIPSGSAKAFLIIPLIVPLAANFDISMQLCILAFCFGDGFSNLFYPTNPVTLISLNLANVSYSKYVKWNWLFQVLMLLLTTLILLLGYVIGY